MLGFLFGTVCLVGFFKVATGHRWHGRYGSHCGGGHRRGRWQGRYGDHGPGWSEKMMLRWLFERLDTTHGQEKVIFDAVEEVRKPLSAMREELHGGLSAISEAFTAESFDHEKVAHQWVEQDKALEQLRVAVTTGLTRVHEVLSVEQRKILADLMASMRRSGFGRGYGF